MKRENGSLDLNDVQHMHRDCDVHLSFESGSDPDTVTVTALGYYNFDRIEVAMTIASFQPDWTKVEFDVVRKWCLKASAMPKQVFSHVTFKCVARVRGASPVYVLRASRRRSSK